MKKTKKSFKAKKTKAKKRYTMDDLRAFTFESKNPNESLVDQIDHIVYGI